MTHGKHSPPECHPQRPARTLSRPPPPTVKQPHACLISRSFMACAISRSFIAASIAKTIPPAGPWCLTTSGKHSPPECQRPRRARTLSRPPPRTVEQPQSCSITSRSLMAASVAKTKPPAEVCCLVCGGKHSPPECHPQRRARTLSRPPPRTVEQPQACDRAVGA